MDEDVQLLKELEYQIGLSAALVNICNSAFTPELNKASKLLGRVIESGIIPKNKARSYDDVIHDLSIEFYSRCDCQGKPGAKVMTVNLGDQTYYYSSRLKKFINISNPEDSVTLVELVKGI